MIYLRQLSVSLPFAALMACSPAIPVSVIRDDFRHSLRLKDHLPEHLTKSAPAPISASGNWRPIWRGKKQDLLAEFTRDDEILSAITENPVVMVSFEPDSALATILSNNPATILWHQGTAEEDGFALVQPGSAGELGTWAQLAHSRPGLACGLLEYVNGQALAMADLYQGPEYAESVKLPAITALVDLPEDNKIRHNIEQLEALGTRYHEQESGLLAPEKIAEMMTTAGQGIPGFSVSLFDHSSTQLTQQKSVVATIPGSDPNLPTIVVGAHLDSIHRADETNAPGADDDASGVATIIEVIRSLASQRSEFRRSIEFHAYAAEEIGLVGSNHLAQTYRNSGKPIAAMLQLDMVAWSTDPKDLTIHLLTNDTNANLRRSLKELLKTYLNGGYEEGTLSAGTSDHRSWTNNGFNAVFPFEHPIHHNSYIHSALDTLSTINNIPLATRFAQLVLAFLGHHAGLTAASTQYEDGSKQDQPAQGADIKIAILAGANASWDIAAATPSDVAKVETCLVASAAAADCGDTLSVLKLAGTRNQRNFFINDANQSLAIIDGGYRRFVAYDAHDRAAYARTVKLTAK